MCVCMYVITINEIGGYELEKRTRRSIWEGLEGEEGSKKWCNCIIITKTI